MEDADRYREWASRVNITEHPPAFKTAVFEGSQGVLLDESVGFHPHTTWSKLTFDVAHACYRHLRISIFTNVGCIRTYHTRHGAGPLPTEADLGLTDEGNPENEYQGEMRFGHFDWPLFRYALTTLGEIGKLALSHCDETPKQYCVKYENELSLWPPACIEDQVDLCLALKEAKPVLADFDLLQITTRLPILYKSYGPKLSDKE